MYLILYQNMDWWDKCFGPFRSFFCCWTLSVVHVAIWVFLQFWLRFCLILWMWINLQGRFHPKHISVNPYLNLYLCIIPFTCMLRWKEKRISWYMSAFYVWTFLLFSQADTCQWALFYWLFTLAFIGPESVVCLSVIVIVWDILFQFGHIFEMCFSFFTVVNVCCLNALCVFWKISIYKKHTHTKKK